MDQWPLQEERLQGAFQLVQEQLNSGHAMPSNTPWNSPIIIIKKKSGKWRLTQDLRKVNETMKLRSFTVRIACFCSHAKRYLSIKDVMLVFTAGSSNGRAAFVVNGKGYVVQMAPVSAKVTSYSYGFPAFCK